MQSLNSDCAENAALNFRNSWNFKYAQFLHITTDKCTELKLTKQQDTNVCDKDRFHQREDDMQTVDTAEQHRLKPLHTSLHRSQTTQSTHKEQNVR